MWHIQPRRPFWKWCHKMRLRGGKNWTPIFQAYLTLKEAKKAIKSILAKTFNFRHFSDIPHQIAFPSPTAWPNLNDTTSHLHGRNSVVLTTTTKLKTGSHFQKSKLLIINSKSKQNCYNAGGSCSKVLGGIDAHAEHTKSVGGWNSNELCQLTQQTQRSLIEAECHNSDDVCWQWKRKSVDRREQLHDGF